MLIPLEDGAAVSAAGWLLVNEPFASLIPPEPSDLHRAGSPEAAGETAVRLVRREHDAPELPPSGSWVRVRGVWREREISVTDVRAQPVDLSLLRPPRLRQDHAPGFGEEFASQVGRVFSDRRRRWDLLAIAHTSRRLSGPVVSVVAVRTLPEIVEYLAGLPEGAVEFRPWLTSVDD